jgi:hypothetical protein
MNRDFIFHSRRGQRGLAASEMIPIAVAFGLRQNPFKLRQVKQAEQLTSERKKDWPMTDATPKDA